MFQIVLGTINNVKKIIDYAKQVKYRPNYLAKSLSSGKTKTIGLVVPFIGDTFYAQVAMEVELVAEQLGYTVTFLQFPNLIR